MHGENKTITCPKCEKTGEQEVIFSINAQKDPGLREKLLDGDINKFTCAACGWEGPLNAPVIYHDPEKGFLVHFLPFSILEDKRVLAGYGPDGRPVADLSGLEPEKPYLTEPHLVFDMGEMVRYIIFRELVFGRHEAEKNG